ncbi:UNVERIFIED_CONTAM: hypothetical protein GTU68_043279 [Idotea baltica]|nr:hypothetical protein [Idotea baltica]
MVPCKTSSLETSRMTAAQLALE